MEEKEAVAVQTFYGRASQESGAGHAARRKAGRRNKTAPLNRREERGLSAGGVLVIFVRTWIGKGGVPGADGRLE
jgi:hypothetical protein